MIWALACQPAPCGNLSCIVTVTFACIVTVAFACIVTVTFACITTVTFACIVAVTFACIVTVTFACIVTVTFSCIVAVTLGPTLLAFHDSALARLVRRSMDVSICTLGCTLDVGSRPFKNVCVGKIGFRSCEKGNSFLNRGALLPRFRLHGGVRKRQIQQGWQLPRGREFRRPSTLC